MAEQEFTEAGKVGQKLRSGLASAYNAAKRGAKWGRNYLKDFVTEYGDETLLNLYPQAVNLTAAAGEAIAGVADKPVNLGRYPYYNLQTQFDEPLTGGTSQEPEPPTPKRTLENSDLLSEYYGGVDNVPVRRAEAVNKKQESKKLNYVVKTYGENPTSEVFTDKEKAKAALKNLYAKNQKATMSNVPEDQAEQFAVGSMDKIAKNKEAIRKLRSPQTEEEILQVAENKGRMEEAWAEANKAKRAKDKEAGAGFASWRSDVKARRGSEDTLNRYNQSIGLLKQAYTQAMRSGNFEKAFDISERIQKEEADVPREMGARKKYFEESAIRNRDAMLVEQERLAREEAERNSRTQAANPDYINPFNKTVGMRYQ